jgi:RNA polymerase sigma-70 factor (ECF subfamily)
MTSARGTSRFSSGVIPGGCTVAWTVTGAGQLLTHSPPPITTAIAASPVSTLRGRRRIPPPTARSQAGGSHRKFPTAEVRIRRILLMVVSENTGRRRPIFQRIVEYFRDAAASGLKPPSVKPDPFLVTRRSLVERLANRSDRRVWQEFFDTYWKLIYSVALKSGLSDAEAQDVVQETIITVSRKIDKLRYDPALGSFKGWLLHMTRWRIADQFRKRQPDLADQPTMDEDRRTAPIDRIADGFDLDAVWDAEWRAHLLEAAMDRVRRRVDPKQFQIFDCYVVRDWPAQKVAAELRVNIAQVYLARHRVAALIRREVETLEKGEQ